MIDAALDALSRGDEAFWRGERPAAVLAWREALVAAVPCDAPACRAVEAMAHLRLVRREGNLAPLWHEGAWTRALAACPAAEPLCVLAEADRRLTVPAFAGGDPASVPALVAPLVDDPAWAAAAVARHALALARGAPGAPLAWPARGADGMARGMQALGRAEPADPGTWTLGIGVTAAPYAGVGGLVRFVEPDVAGHGHRLSVLATADSWGNAAASASFAARTVASPTASVALSHATWWRWEGDTALGQRLDRLDASATVGAARGPVAAWGGVAALVAEPGAPVQDPAASAGIATWLAPPVHAVGPTFALRLADAPRRATATATLRDLVGVDDGAHHALLGLDGRLRVPLGRVELAFRLAGDAAPGETVGYLQPAVGGTALLRGLPYGRFRAEALAAAQAEVRVRVVGPLHAAAFADSAWCDGLHASVGGGLRLVLPPERENVTRLDLGWSPEGWGVVLGFGEAF